MNPLAPDQKRKRNNNDTNRSDFLQLENDELIVDHQSNTSSEFYEKFTESLMIITVAGFGGALSGLSVARARAAASATTHQYQNASVAAAAAFRNKSKGARKRQIAMAKKGKGGLPFVHNNNEASIDHLPIKWALTCMSFVSIVEGIGHWVKPCHNVNDFLKSSEIFNNNHNSELSSSSLQKKTTSLSMNPSDAICTIGDYVIGGGLAGFVFKGTQIVGNQLQQSSAKLKQPPSSFGRGIFPGLALGFTAGCLQYILQVAQKYVKEIEKENDEIEMLKSILMEKERRGVLLDTTAENHPHSSSSAKSSNNHDNNTQDISHLPKEQQEELRQLEVKVKKMTMKEIDERLEKLKKQL